MADHEPDMWVGWIEADLLLGDVHSLKEKRSVIRPVINELRRSTEASVAETGHQDLHRRATIGVAMASGDSANLTSSLAAVERRLAGHPEFEVLTTRQRIIKTSDVA